MLSSSFDFIIKMCIYGPKTEQNEDTNHNKPRTDLMKT